MSILSRRSSQLVAQMSKGKSESTIGWREWVSLPKLGVEKIKCKVDTGARTSALHAFYIEPYHRENKLYVKFGLHPLQRNKTKIVECKCQVLDIRTVVDSGGHSEKRYVIITPVKLGLFEWTAEFTLTDRENMLFRMLLGREAIKNKFVVDPSRSYLASEK